MKDAKWPWGTERHGFDTGEGLEALEAAIDAALAEVWRGGREPMRLELSAEDVGLLSKGCQHSLQWAWEYNGFQVVEVGALHSPFAAAVISIPRKQGFEMSPVTRREHAKVSRKLHEIQGRIMDLEREEAELKRYLWVLEGDF